MRLVTGRHACMQPKCKSFPIQHPWGAVVYVTRPRSPPKGRKEGGLDGDKVATHVRSMSEEHESKSCSAHTRSWWQNNVTSEDDAVKSVLPSVSLVAWRGHELDKHPSEFRRQLQQRLFTPLNDMYELIMSFRGNLTPRV